MGMLWKGAMEPLVRFTIAMPFLSLQAASNEAQKKGIVPRILIALNETFFFGLFSSLRIAESTKMSNYRPDSECASMEKRPDW